MTTLSLRRSRHDPAQARRALEAYPHSSSDLIEIGDFTIRTAERTAALSGQDLHLTSEEFDALMFLLNRPRCMITPRTVLTTNWPEQVRQTEFLKVFLSLRKKLEAIAGDKQYLRTEPLIVYRFDPASFTP